MPYITPSFCFTIVLLYKNAIAFESLFVQNNNGPILRCNRRIAGITITYAHLASKLFHSSFLRIAGGIHLGSVCIHIGQIDSPTVGSQSNLICLMLGSI